MIDEKGRCCGKKPLVYKKPSHYLFCSRCDKAFNPEGQQIENWAYRKNESDKFVPRSVMSRIADLTGSMRVNASGAPISKLIEAQAKGYLK